MNMTEKMRSRIAIGLALLALLVTVGSLVYQQGAAGEVVTQGTRWWGAGGFALPAAGKVTVDGSTIAQTQTGGAVDINMASITADTSALNVASTQNNGAATGTDQYAAIFTMTGSDADGDNRGISIAAANTGVEAAGSYEYGLSYACAVTVAGGCTDGVIFTSAGVASGLTDAVDASAANIDNAINIGDNLIAGTDDSLSVGATDDTVILNSNDSDGTYTCTDADANAGCTFAGGGTGATTLGRTTSTSVNVRGVAFDLDITGGASIDADLASNFSTAAGDITVDAETGSVNIIGSEGAGTAIHLDGNDTALGGVQIDANTGGVDVNLTSTGPFAIDGALTNIGTGTYKVADDDNDLGVDGDAEINTGLYVADTLTVTTASALFGYDGAGKDVYFYSDSAGDYGLYDTGGSRFYVLGIDGTPAIDVADGYINMEEDEYWDNVTDGSVILNIDATEEYTFTASLLDLGGNCLDLDDAGTSSICADTDDEIDVEIAGGDVIEITANAMSLSIPIWSTSYVSAEDLSNFEGGLWGGYGADLTLADNTVVTGTLDAQGDVSNSTGDFTVADDMDVTASLEVVSYIQTTSYVSVEDESYLQGDLIDLVGDLTIADNAVITGTLDVTGATALVSTLSVGDDITMENDETWSNATDEEVVTDGMLGFRQWVVDTAASLTLAAADSGTLVINDGVSGMIYVTLPDSSAIGAGVTFGIFAEDDHDIRVEPETDEQILSCTNAVGDACVVDDQYECIWLVSNVGGWLVVNQMGTPADGD